jgi:autotransporter-associated beta strand protein
MKFRSSPFRSSFYLVIAVSTLQSHADIFDTNGTVSGFGVTNGSTYDWWTANFWSDTASLNDGTASVVTWQGLTGNNQQAYFVGSGIAGQNYTVRLGPTGATDTYVQNIFTNMKADGTGSIAGAAGNVTIGNSGDLGNLILSGNNSVGAHNSSTLTINNVLNLNAKTMNYRGGTVVINGSIIGTGTSHINATSGSGLSSGTLTLAGDNSFAGNVTIASGYVVRLSHANALGAVGGTNTVAASGSMEVAGGVTINSGESVSIAGDGGSLIGALRAGTGGGTWAGGVTLENSSSVGPRIGATAGNTLTITGTIANGTTGTGFNISGQSGTGVVVLNPTGTNTYTGTTGIFRGILRLGKSNALPTGTTLDVDAASGVSDAAIFDLASFDQTVAVLQDTAGDNIGGKIRNSVASTNSTLTVNQASTTDFGGIIEDGSGTVVLTKTGVGSLQLSGANTFTGGTNIKNGSIAIIGNDNRLPTGGSVVLGDVATSGVLIIGSSGVARTQTLGGLTTTGLGGSVVGAHATNKSILVLDIASGTNVFNGTLGGSTVNENNLALTKAGSGTLSLTTGHTFTGDVTVNAGTLSISHSNALGAGTKNFFMQGASRKLELTNGITLGSNITLNLQTNTNNGVISSSGTNGIQGAISLTGGGASIGSDGSSTLTLSGNITANGGTGLTLYGTSLNNNTVSGVIADGSTITTLTKEHVGTWVLSNANTFKGNTKVNSGTLKLSHNLAIQNSAFDTSGAGTLDTTTINTPTFGGLTSATNYAISSNVTSLTLNPASTITHTYTGDLSGGAAGLTLTKTGTGTQILGGTNTYSGLTTVNGGELRITNAAAIGGTNVTVTTGQLALDGGITVSGKSLTTSGSGTNVIGGLQSVSGTNEWAGSVLLGANNSRIGARKNATLVVSGGIDDGANTYNLVVRNEHQGSSNNGAGNSTTITELSGVSTHGGNTNLIAGLTRLAGGDNRLPTGTILQFGLANQNAKFDMNGRNQEVAGLAVLSTTNDAARDWNANELTNSSGTLSTLTVNTAADQTFGLTTSSFTGSGNYTGIITGNIALVKSGSAQLTLSGSNSYTGGTRIDAGTFVLGHATNTLSDTGAVHVDGGTLALGANSDTVGAVTLTSGSITGSGSGTLTGSGSNYDVRSGSVSAILGGSIGLDKSTGGTVTLTGANSYTGTTTVNTGSLALGTGGSISASTTIDIKGSATLDVSTLGGWALANGQTLVGNGTVDAGGTGNTVSISNGAFLAPGASPGTLLINGDLSLASGSTFNAEIQTSGSPTSDLVNVNGDLDIINGGLLSLGLFNTDATLANGSKFSLFSYSGSWNTGTFTGYADDSSFVLGLNQFLINYNDTSGGVNGGSYSNFVTLTVVPEPRAALLGALGLFALLRRRRY